MTVQWTIEALQDRDEIWMHIAADSPSAAAKVDQMFSKAASKLGKFPMLGRPGIIQGTRELFPHENYRLVYEINGDIVSIIALVHTSRQWPQIH